LGAINDAPCIGMGKPCLEDFAINDLVQTESKRISHNNKGWLVAIQAALRSVAINNVVADMEDMPVIRKTELQLKSQLEQTLHEIQELERLRISHAAAAHQLEQKLKKGKAAYGDLLYKYTELERAVNQRKQLLDRDQQVLEEELVKELECQDRINALKVKLERTTVKD